MRLSGHELPKNLRVQTAKRVQRRPKWMSLRGGRKCGRVFVSVYFERVTEAKNWVATSWKRFRKKRSFRVGRRLKNKRTRARPERLQCEPFELKCRIRCESLAFTLIRVEIERSLSQTSAFCCWKQQQEIVEDEVKECAAEQQKCRLFFFSKDDQKWKRRTKCTQASDRRPTVAVDQLGVAERCFNLFVGDKNINTFSPTALKSIYVSYRDRLFKGHGRRWRRVTKLSTRWLLNESNWCGQYQQYRSRWKWWWWWW